MVVSIKLEAAPGTSLSSLAKGYVLTHQIEGSSPHTVEYFRGTLNRFQLDPNGIPIPMLQSGITDARLFAKLGIQTYGFLPMKLPPGFDFVELLHGADERIPAEALAFGTEAIYKLLQCFG